jgi:hypothetical protein
MTAPTEQNETTAARRQTMQPGSPLPIWTRLRKKVAPDATLRHHLLRMARHMAEWCFRDAPRRMRVIDLLGKFHVVLACESPNLAKICRVSGFASVQGWALSKSKVERICVFIDAVFVGEAFYGFRCRDEVYSRNGVGGNSGFAFRLDTSKFGLGAHTIKVVASAYDGNTASLEGVIEVVDRETD